MERIKKALDCLQRYAPDFKELHPGYEFRMVQRRKGMWVRFEDAKTAISQAVADYQATEERAAKIAKILSIPEKDLLESIVKNGFSYSDVISTAQSLLSYGNPVSVESITVALQKKEIS